MMKTKAKHEEVTKAGIHGGVQGTGVHAAAQGVAKAERELGVVEQTLRSWVKASKAGRLNAGGKDVTPKQIGLSRI